jgi:hypothetical protein
LSVGHLTQNSNGTTLKIKRDLNTIIQIEGAITLQLEARQITNPADQLRVVRHVALSYRTLIEAPLSLIGMTPSADDFIHLGDAASIQ